MMSLPRRCSFGIFCATPMITMDNNSSLMSLGRATHQPTRNGGEGAAKAVMSVFRLLAAKFELRPCDAAEPWQLG
ncbi:hypothetical protein F2Q70_00022770 [Brassica cretica]|uniref:Uncharacterized protein n=1 Tax=Brassica cretica TaxID=69181 RepID=A0A8S9GRV2_BRACR|nr:hypothetical protein F2Q70_00022770 [Brassica cretica]KAF3608889.1 hypothetical protein DY000_02049530 [Brassica cretica]